MADKYQYEQAIMRSTFIKTNGEILRFLNLMDARERRLSNISVVLNDVKASDLRSCLRYLNDAGYIRIDHKNGAACLADGPLDLHIKVDITASGMELLMGITENPSVEV